MEVKVLLINILYLTNINVMKNTAQFTLYQNVYQSWNAYTFGVSI